MVSLLLQHTEVKLSKHAEVKLSVAFRCVYAALVMESKVKNSPLRPSLQVAMRKVYTDSFLVGPSPSQNFPEGMVPSARGPVVSCSVQISY